MIENSVPISGEIRVYDDGGKVVRVNVGHYVAVEVTGKFVQIDSEEVSALVGEAVRAAVLEYGRRLRRGEHV